MKKINLLIITIFLFLSANSYSDINSDFEKWKTNFKKVALSNNISEQTYNLTIKDTKYLPNVIKYDRFQPEFYEDTKTYIQKRTSEKKVKSGKTLFEKNIDLISKVEKEFKVEKELMLALMGIETNFGTYVGKMDILSSVSYTHLTLPTTPYV